MVVGTALIILALQIWGSYTLIRNIFRWLALTLLAYVGAAFLAKPDLLPVLQGTLCPVLNQVLHSRPESLTAAAQNRSWAVNRVHPN
jgi:hypothetical protein